MLATIRSHDQYNTTIYSLDDRYRGVFGGRMVVFMNKDDMAERQIEPDSLVELEVGDGWRRCAPNRERLQGEALQYPAGFDRRVLSGDERSDAAELSRPEEQDAVREVDPGVGAADGRRCCVTSTR